MPLDPKIEKKIDTLYRNTQQIPVLSFLGILIPIVLVAASALGVLYWFSRRRLLEEIDSGKLVIDSAPPPIPVPGKVGSISTATKVDYIRSHKHTLLVPLYILIVVVILLGSFIAYMVMNDTRP